ncbi:uncharacterized protein ColSpa_10957 [Colletotrichum spaethianum]|uniref:Fucose-specific lectin n=1 Tax=Colletotrichum spaethianum TaxID=700344 RepID=A0AA37UKX6_9PEZI|nr:uncharacterized protein ColSpa_10957 [Colletotrichum spaethianum]GKT50776.1 hypothetical protein ColSpa_10957 [Colletotrichum spaethianum]
MTRSFKCLLGAILLLSSPASCLTAWWTDLSPHVAMQDPATGNLLYSACNSNSTPIFPDDGLNAFKLQRKPRNGTSLTAAGWYDVEAATTVASIFYQTDDGAIVNGYFVCNFATGHYNIKGEYLISSTASVESIHSETGLAVELLGAEDGYRVFFHDEDKKVNVMSYTTKTDWQLQGAISQDPVGGMALTSVHSGQSNISVVYPKDSENFEISRFFKDETWHLVNGKTNASDVLLNSSIQPNFTLPAYASNLTGLGVTVNHTYVRSIFYIGTDAKLHQVSNVDWEWKLMPDRESSIWPVADAVDGPFAATSNFDTNEAWVWYRSNGSLVQLYQGTDGLWTQATTVPSVNTTKSLETEPNGNATPTASPTGKSIVMSTGAKAGIGIGVAVGVLALAGVGFLLFQRRRRQQAAAAEAARLKEAEAMTLNGRGGPYAETWGSVSPTEKYGSELVEADAVGTTAPQELMDTTERYELVGEGHWREMDATGQNPARRSIGGWREAQAQDKGCKAIRNEVVDQTR